MKKTKILFLVLLSLCAWVCERPSSSSSETNDASTSSAATKVLSNPVAVSRSATQNHLSMKIDGVPWQADSEIFGAFHPKGYNNAILIAGSKGPNNAAEQNFNINLYNAVGPGEYKIKNGNPDNSVAQLANLTTDRFMYGSVMGFEMRVSIGEGASSGIVNATFEGELTGNQGDKIKITDGRFSYHE